MIVIKNKTKERHSSKLRMKKLIHTGAEKIVTKLPAVVLASVHWGRESSLMIKERE
jgi:hypothetical protein